MRPHALLKKHLIVGVSLAAFLVSSFITTAQACTRVVYLGENNAVVTGRSMDWAEDMHTNLWLFPRGVSRDGAAGPHSPKWVSKYGSIVASGYDVGTADGMNEKGLVANVLYLAESDYGKPNGKPPLSIAIWAQYVLDQFATVDEAVTHLKTEPFRLISPSLPNGVPASLHLSISDASGDSAIFEYVDGKQVIHHSRQFQVMTNSPTFDQQLALNTYWQEIGGLTFLPGTNRAADRFARASFLIHAVPTSTDPHYISAIPERKYDYQAVASTLGVVRSVSVPLGITTPSQPNIASTLWRTVADQKNKIYYFDSATSPNTFWVELKDLNFSKGAPIKKLTVAGGKVYSGNTASQFEVATPFEFLRADPSK
ncbi:linear amide C-N hydrolase [Polynucleobacter sp. P1-05-14]|jgi:choloylglycine hydrolase|uniref:linear amide C-N hydrolase n=1 Tax=Polynucleobacter sp. P1-05-14 TaxID=1819732 RepID=UPI001C0CBA53|nr:linear amide C-N hydrolase [Polynucleobacter sp. P1-05-14]MBU3549110.1 linear amide C-N hydrolase [Polynucleobacter sp. P1-05-14]